jgi:hypothetical protein
MMLFITVDPVGQCGGGGVSLAALARTVFFFNVIYCSLANCFHFHVLHPNVFLLYPDSETRSKFNLPEAQRAAALAKYLAQQGQFGEQEIVVLTLYTEQAAIIKDLLGAVSFRPESDKMLLQE